MSKAWVSSDKDPSPPPRHTNPLNPVSALLGSSLQQQQQQQQQNRSSPPINPRHTLKPLDQSIAMQGVFPMTTPESEESLKFAQALRHSPFLDPNSFLPSASPPTSVFSASPEVITMESPFSINSTSSSTFSHLTATSNCSASPAGVAAAHMNLPTSRSAYSPNVTTNASHSTMQLSAQSRSASPFMMNYHQHNSHTSPSPDQFSTPTPTPEPAPMQTLSHRNNLLLRGSGALSSSNLDSIREMEIHPPSSAHTPGLLGSYINSNNGAESGIASGNNASATPTLHLAGNSAYLQQLDAAAMLKLTSPPSYDKVHGSSDDVDYANRQTMYDRDEAASLSLLNAHSSTMSPSALCCPSVNGVSCSNPAHPFPLWHWIWLFYCSPRFSKARWVTFGFLSLLVAYYFVLAPMTSSGRNNNSAGTVSNSNSQLLSSSLESMSKLMGELTMAQRSTVYDRESDQFKIDTTPMVANGSLSTSNAANRQLFQIPLSNLPCESCAFRFNRPAPRSPTASIYVTAIPNHGAGVGHQFAEWVVGPWLAHKLNLTYLNTDLLIQSKRWNAFLGMNVGEETVEDVHVNYGGFAQIYPVNYPTDREEYQKFSILNWTISTLQGLENNRELQALRSHIDLLRQTNAAASANTNNAVAATTTSGADATSSNVGGLNIFNPAFKALTPSKPFPILIQANLIAIPKHGNVCDADLNRVLRQKYCLARLRNPVSVDYYADHRKENAIIVTWHLRCGDSCYQPFRITSFESIVKTSIRVQAILKGMDATRPVKFHFFSQAPHNNTAENHFKPLMDTLHANGIDTAEHWSAKSHTVLHHLVTSDVLFGAQSGFSWLSFIHHNGVSLGAIPSCVDPIPYDKWKGEFDEAIFAKVWNKYKDRRPKFDSYQDCLDMQ